MSGNETKRIMVICPPSCSSSGEEAFKDTLKAIYYDFEHNYPIVIPPYWTYKIEEVSAEKILNVNDVVNIERR